MTTAAFVNETYGGLSRIYCLSSFVFKPSLNGTFGAAPDTAARQSIAGSQMNPHRCVGIKDLRD